MDSDLVVKQVEAIIEPQEEAPDLEVKKIVGQEPELVTPLQDFYGIEEPSDKQKEQLNLVWNHFNTSSKNKGETLKAISQAQLDMAHPEIGQTRLGQLYNYVRVLNELDSLKSEKAAYETK